MIPNKIFEIGSMLGLKHKEIVNILSTNSNHNKLKNLPTRDSPVDNYKAEVKYGTVSTKDFKTYKDGTWYGTISINDF